MRFAKTTSWQLSLVLIVSGVIAPASQSAQTDVEKRINDLIARMTLEEKLGQLQQLDGEANGNYRPEHRDLIRKGLLGSTLNVRGARRTNELQ
ncbi:MAG: glycosyl hydrolase, partial [Pyrinomonadaceae bacterium]|nr:glycosyl hydrolase [Pyrinomonadaceae bacterium]